MDCKAQAMAGFTAACFLLLVAVPAAAQVAAPTGEASIDSGSGAGASTVIGGYGNAVYQRDFNAESVRASLERFVLFVGHRFTRNISFFSELEVEDAKVSGGEPGGEVAVEQAYLRFSLDRDNFFIAGLFIPRIGILNEEHLPTGFNGNERNQVETLVIPATWRELGVGFTGSFARIPLRYTVGLMNGLNSSAFEHDSGIREGRFEGRSATANNLAATVSVRFEPGDVQIQLSGYAGGTVGLTSRQADSLRLTSGAFGTPVFLGEGHVRYESRGLRLCLLGCVISIPDAGEINRAYANNTPSLLYGAYAEAGYNLFQDSRTLQDQQLIAFVRFEKLDLNAKVPSNGLVDGTLNQSHITAGLSYLPTPSVVVKADVRLAHYGSTNPSSFTEQENAVHAIQGNNTFLNLGIGFSF